MVSPENKILAKYLKAEIGGKFSAFKYLDETGVKSVHIVSLQDASDIGASTFSSIGLSDTSINLAVEHKPLRIELIMSCYSAQEMVANILSTCVFEVMDNPHRARPDIILPRIIELYLPESHMSHVLLTDPYSWDLSAQYLDSKVVTWLLAVPISEAEYLYAQQDGVEALKNLLERNSVDTFNLNRPSVL